MPPVGSACSLLVLLMLGSMAAAGDGNRLAYLDEPCDPYYVGLDTPRLITPQWVGRPGVEAVIVLATDDLREPARHEAFLRPILERLKKIDSRAPVSLMTNQTDPKHPQLQKWLAEGASLEAHTWDHPCPLLQGGDLAVAKATYDRSVDLVAGIADNRPVAFRMPCCDSMTSVSPRFFTEIFNQTTPKGSFLALDSSVFLLFTANDRELPRRLVLDTDGRETVESAEWRVESGKPPISESHHSPLTTPHSSGRFRKYVPADKVMANLIENYPYPYVIGRLCWEIPVLMPSDWDAQHLNGVCSPSTVRDLKAAVDAVVVKRGIFSICFHPHGWIRNDQIVEVVDYAVDKYGGKIQFLTFRQVYDRLTDNLLQGQPLRTADGRDNGVRVLDVDGDGYMDVVIGNRQAQQTRVWDPHGEGGRGKAEGGRGKGEGGRATGRWSSGPFPMQLVGTAGDGARGLTDVHFGVVQATRRASFLTFQYAAWHFDGRQWSTRGPRPGAPSDADPVGIEAAKRAGTRLLDVDGDGVCEAILRSEGKDWLCRWVRERDSFAPQCRLPEGVQVVDDRGRDAGLRFVDVDEDGRLDLVFSNAQRYSLHLFTSMKEGWSRKILHGRRGQTQAKDEIPPLVRADGTNNGAWFGLRHLWVQNEETGGKLPGHVFGRRFTQLLHNDREPPSPSPEGY